jgi:hypothetical protein
MATQRYNGEDWPYEALQEQIEHLKENEVFVLLLGERQDVEGIREITTTYSHIMRYGRPFQPLYSYIIAHPDEHLLFRFEEPFKHAQFTVQPGRLALLQKMIEQRSTLLYQLVYMKDGQRIVEGNFAYAEQGTLTLALEQAMIERGWQKRIKKPKKYSPYYLGIYERIRLLKEIRAGCRPEYYTSDRWWHELYHWWHKK